MKHVSNVHLYPLGCQGKGDINPAKYPSDKCPDCNLEQHTTCHLFTCPANTTDLTPRDLWDNPTEVAAFLGLPNHQEVNLDDND